MRLWTTLLLLVFLVSCSVQATLTLPESGATDVEASFRIAPQTREAWNALRDLDPSLPADPFNPLLLQKSLGPGGKVSSSEGVTSLHFSVSDLTKYVPTWKAGKEAWEGTIDRATVRRWAGLTAWAGSPAVDSLLPAPGTTVSESEYRDLLVYLLGPGLSESAAKALIAGSTVQLTIVAPRTVRTAPGSQSISDRTVVYRWPLTQVLTLETPLRIRLNF